MAAIVAPGICRFTINQTYGGNEVANILDMQVDTTGDIIPRNEAILTVAHDILQNWDEHIRLFQVAALSCDSVSWVDLDSLDGSTGTTTDGNEGGATWPEAGNSATAGMPGNVSLLVRKVSGGGRRARNGRWFIAGIAESLTVGEVNRINPAELPSLNDAMQDFLEGVTDNSISDTPQRQPVVLHTVGGVFTDYDDVDALQVQPLLATQRRRLRD